MVHRCIGLRSNVCIVYSLDDHRGGICRWYVTQGGAALYPGLSPYASLGQRRRCFVVGKIGQTRDNLLTPPMYVWFVVRRIGRVVTAVCERNRCMYGSSYEPLDGSARQFVNAIEWHGCPIRKVVPIGGCPNGAEGDSPGQAERRPGTAGIDSPWYCSCPAEAGQTSFLQRCYIIYA